MHSAKFVEVIRQCVRDAAIEDTIAKLEHPPGRRIPPEERARSDWYNGLSEVEAAHVKRVVADAVHEAVFGFLVVLDGARAIESGPAKGRLELTYVNDQRVVLNDPNSIGLHDLFNAER